MCEVLEMTADRSLLVKTHNTRKSQGRPPDCYKCLVFAVIMAIVYTRRSV